MDSRQLTDMRARVDQLLVEGWSIRPRAFALAAWPLGQGSAWEGFD